MYEQVFQLVEKLGLTNRVHIKGYIPTQNLPIVYNLAKLFVYPSTYEGFGFPPLEAMACGTPVITTAISAMLDNVGDAGLLIPPQDESALTNAIETLLSDIALRDHLSIAGRLRAAEFTWERTALETLKVYQLVGAKS
jgi:glycosyltransferase involved in cell wall biosynthesis